jgi:chemotaxis protein MotB
MTTDKARPIIIVKKKGGHGGHHGGAWKVAYADFVTAMMALFIVLWLMNTSKPVKEAIAGYFKDPSGTGKEIGTSKVSSGEALTISQDNVTQLKEKLEKAIEQMTNFPALKNQIEMTVTAEGLRIELLESATGTFFDLGKPWPNDNGRELLVTLAHELGTVPNRISIEGHTDATPFAGKGEYGNWELSADRANSARRIMQQSGLRADQVSQVRGYADQKLRYQENPHDPSNRRISVIVHYIEKPAGEATSEKETQEASGHGERKNPESKPSPGHETTPEHTEEHKDATEKHE